MPTLDVDGKVIVQYHAIMRYLANEFKLYGANNEDRIVIDQVCEIQRDVMPEIFKISFSKETEEKKVTNNFHNYLQTEYCIIIANQF